MSTLEFRSPRDGSVFALAITGRAEQEATFEIAVRTPWFTGRAHTSTWHNGSPVEMFSLMARDWRGWTGEKQWQDIEGEVILKAIADATGHISLVIELHQASCGNRLKVVIQYDAGQLEEMAEAVTTLFDLTPDHN